MPLKIYVGVFQINNKMYPVSFAGL